MKITVDRSSARSVQDQLVEQIRFHIACGSIEVGRGLPSTRGLAKQVGVSFHTVRKAYQQLEADGVLESKVGSGFWVRQRTALGKAERIEQGASVVHEAVQRLIGIGLQPDEVEHLVHEQLALLSDAPAPKVVLAAATLELADLIGQQLRDALQQALVLTPTGALADHPDAEFVLTPFTEYRAGRAAVANPDVLGLATTPSPEALELVARLLQHETLLLVTKEPDTAPVLARDLQAASGFAGPVLAGNMDEDRERLRRMMAQSDLALYTPPCRRRIAPHVPERLSHGEVTLVVSPLSVAMVRERLPG